MNILREVIQEPRKIINNIKHIETWLHCEKENSFIQCNKCNSKISLLDFDIELGVCSSCGFHFRIDSKKRIEIIFDKKSVKYFDKELRYDYSNDFPGYTDKLARLKENTNMESAVITGIGKIFGKEVCFGVMDYRFIMGSLGSIEGEKLTRMIEKAIERRLPVIIFSASGGARIQEGVLALNQMIKVSAVLKKHGKENLLYLSVLTDPTTGGVNASFASLGDIIIAEPNTTVGFAGKRVIKQTIDCELPAGFQTAEFMLEHGFIDSIIKRKELKSRISYFLDIHDKGKIKKVKSLRHRLSNKEKSIKLQKDIQKKFSSWEKVKISRGSKRLKYKEYIDGLIDGFVELHGDRSYRDDAAIIGGVGFLNDLPITVISNGKGRNLKENIHRNFGMAHPEGYRKAIRLMKQAEKHGRPVLCLIDTPGAFCGVGAEKRGQGEAIARALAEMSDLKTPVIVVVIGEGGSGGALALGVGDYIYMLENSVYSVISPEGAASIVLKDSSKASEICRFLKLTSNDLLNLGIIDEIIPEPLGGITEKNNEFLPELKIKIYKRYLKLLNKSNDELIKQRYKKIRMRIK